MCLRPSFSTPLGTATDVSDRKTTLWRVGAASGTCCEKNVVFCNEETARNVDSVLQEIHRCVQLATLIAETVDKLETRVACGLACLEARFGSKRAPSESDMALAESRITDRATMKFNGEYKRKMNEEDKHTIEDHECLHTVVRKLQMDVVALKKKAGVQCLEHCGSFVGEREQWRWSTHGVEGL